MENEKQKKRIDMVSTICYIDVLLRNIIANHMTSGEHWQTTFKLYIQDIFVAIYS